ncbi:hypothetical protein AB0L65_16930 [Nonomuraea sp. NPDC052116]|uniref:hypothetical protein n=1 Tax=Nonomuraea sp. NPDC052116 TaxID=3155665 RepID=UPI003425B2A6
MVGQAEVFLGESRSSAWIGADRPDQGDAPALGGVVDDVWSDIAGVDQALDRSQTAGSQAGVDGFQGVDALNRCRPGEHMHDHGGPVFVAGFTLMVAVADPFGFGGGLSFLPAVAGLGVMRADDFQSRPRHSVDNLVRFLACFLVEGRVAGTVMTTLPVPARLGRSPGQIPV